MDEELIKLFPEIDLIKDNILKKKVVRVWVYALKSGCWQVKDLRRIPFTLLIDNCQISIVDHIKGVLRVSIKAAQELREVYGDRVKINQDYLISGALLHDIGKLLEYEEKEGKFIKSKKGFLLRHPISGVGLCCSEEIPIEIMHIIASHSWEGDRLKRTPESVIVHHADFMNFEQFL